MPKFLSVVSYTSSGVAILICAGVVEWVELGCLESRRCVRESEFERHHLSISKFILCYASFFVGFDVLMYVFAFHSLLLC